MRYVRFIRFWNIRFDSYLPFPTEFLIIGLIALCALGLSGWLKLIKLIYLYHSFHYM